jgi:hypothetical protein
VSCEEAPTQHVDSSKETWVTAELHTWTQMYCASLHDRNGASRVILDDCHVPPCSPELCGVSLHLHLGVLSHSSPPGTNDLLSFVMGHASCRTATMWFRLLCVELHRGAGPRSSLHGQSILYTAMYLFLRVDDML